MVVVVLVFTFLVAFLFIDLFLFLDHDTLGNSDNLIIATPISTPKHIVPE